MSTNTGLIVPMRVEALLISAADVNYNIFLPANADFTHLPTKKDKTGNVYLSQSVLNPPFTGSRSMAEGIYLHWSLPKALRTGKTDSNGQVDLPDAPNRWLITRTIVLVEDGSVSYKNWVIESDYISVTDQYSQTSVPWTPDGDSDNTWRYLGRVYDYDDWLKNGNKGDVYYPHLNAMGYGIADFAAYYPNCANVFGMYDNSLNGGFDASAAQLSYTVTGWYQNPAADPVSKEVIHGNGNRFGWLFDDHNGQLSPDYLLVQGCTRSVDWEPGLQKGYFPDADDPAAVDITIGNTAPEALAKLIAELTTSEEQSAGHRQNDETEPIELLLNAIQLGALQDLGQPGGMAVFEELLFGAEYKAYQGAGLWDIQPREGQPTSPLDPALARQLQELNELQAATDDKQLQLKRQQQQSFADWSKFMIVQHEYQEGQPSLTDVYNYINEEITALSLLQATISDAKDKIDKSATAIMQALPDSMALVSLAAPRFYQPLDPVLLLAGQDIPPLPPDYTAPVHCVLSEDLINTISLPKDLVQGSQAMDLSAALIPPFGDVSQLPYPGIASSWKALQMLNTDFAIALAILLQQQGGEGNPAIINLTDTETNLRTAQASWLAAKTPENNISFNGPAPEGNILINKWHVPWFPTSISWNIEFTPLVKLDHDNNKSYPPDILISSLQFSKEDFNYIYPTDTDFNGMLQQYQGTTLLSSGAVSDLRTQISEYLKYYKDDALQKILNDLKSTRTLSQSLSGFHDILSMLEPVMQMPVADPAAIARPYYDFSNITLPPAVADQNQRTPLLSVSYNPLRAGRASLRKLYIIDSFGRRKMVNINDLAVSQSIPSRRQGLNEPPEMFLPPRLSQPMQLNFRLLSAADHHVEMTSHADDSPVCGWVVPNHLDSSLMFFDATGAAIGTLLTSASSDMVFWRDAPGSASAGTDMEKTIKDVNPILRQFIEGANANGASYIRNFISTLDETTTYVVPNSGQQNVSTAVLIGTPMALIQVGLGLTLMGGPQPDQSFAALKEDMKRGNVQIRSVAGFTNIEFPILLGSLTELNDGLYGYFKSDNAGEGLYDFRTFYSEAAPPQTAHIKAPLPGTLTVRPADTALYNLALLIDPRCEIHAYTGVLPVKSITIPPAIYSAALSALSFTFLGAPILFTGPEAVFPAPAEGDGTWSWVTLQNNQWEEEDIQTVNQQATLKNAADLSEGWLKLDKNTNS
ncbi:hypothetical protein [Arachidicoccus terrestris]|uniref:hypothetical protein n=1 Tax=Arachidicoccus terrestris TaxID=2875539 RepID=UPI001CC6702C|nr:hypothetical protein [Arachidicoccus terrestris]UAY54336.1 hypothetical protein K9M52_12840 [Arachidicoccus terrestris]